VIFISKLQRLFYTIKFLRLEQILYRLRYKFMPLKSISAHSISNIHYPWLWSGLEVIEPSFYGDQKVKFLNRYAFIKGSEIWNDSHFDKLWLYNLHYFDDLNAKNCLSRKVEQLTLVKKWIVENSPVEGNGWEPYPLSLRLVNWIKWYQRSNVDDISILNSIALQAEALSKQLEYHILGNHLFANAKALIFVGCFLQGKKAEYYLHLGLKILNREVPEQFLADGGHFELSPMYHCILLWDLLDLINLAQITKNTVLLEYLPLWQEYALRAIRWLEVMKHSDGEISFFNDAAIGIAPSPSEIISYAHTLGLMPDVNKESPVVTLAESGYSCITMPAHSLIFDHAAVGPDYLPGHAHADTLSFEWSLGNERVFVNSGTSVYGTSQERLRQRKTAAHNTVEVEGEDSSEVWSGFRVARRAYATLHESKLTESEAFIRASHNGYKRLSSKNEHFRAIKSSPVAVVIVDELSGSIAKATAHLHIHPDVKVKLVDSSSFELTTAKEKKIILSFSSMAEITESTWHPRFGESIANKKIIAHLQDNKLTTSICIEKNQF
jgi:uncharacterized heparinase superfamily protein